MTSISVVKHKSENKHFNDQKISTPNAIKQAKVIFNIKKKTT